jgi:hypothetical protein
MVCKDGSILDVVIDSSVLWDEGRFVHTRCFTRDVTDRKRAENALREADRRKDEFLAMLAHELRNPLAPDPQFAAHPEPDDPQRSDRGARRGDDGAAGEPHGPPRSTT